MNEPGVLVQRAIEASGNDLAVCRVDCDAEQEPVPQAWIWPAIVKKPELAAVKPGQRAMALPLTDINGAVRGLKPGDRIDVVATTPLESPRASVHGKVGNLDVNVSGKLDPNAVVDVRQRSSIVLPLANAAGAQHIHRGGTHLVDQTALDLVADWIRKDLESPRIVATLPSNEPTDSNKEPIR